MIPSQDPKIKEKWARRDAEARGKVYVPPKPGEDDGPNEVEESLRKWHGAPESVPKAKAIGKDKASQAKAAEARATESNDPIDHATAAELHRQAKNEAFKKGDVTGGKAHAEQARSFAQKASPPRSLAGADQSPPPGSHPPGVHGNSPPPYSPPPGTPAPSSKKNAFSDQIAKTGAGKVAAKVANKNPLADRFASEGMSKGAAKGAKKWADKAIKDPVESHTDTKESSGSAVEKRMEFMRKANEARGSDKAKGLDPVGSETAKKVKTWANAKLEILKSKVGEKFGKGKGEKGGKGKGKDKGGSGDFEEDKHPRDNEGKFS